MYGKTLQDFPDRLNAFRDALADMKDAEVNSGFEWALRHLPEFPTPYHIRDCAELAVRESRRKLQDEAQRNQRQIEDRVKDERFDSTDAATRKQEFDELMRKAFENK